MWLLLWLLLFFQIFYELNMVHFGCVGMYRYLQGGREELILGRAPLLIAGVMYVPVPMSYVYIPTAMCTMHNCIFNCTGIGGLG